MQVGTPESQHVIWPEAEKQYKCLQLHRASSNGSDCTPIKNKNKNIAM